MSWVVRKNGHIVELFTQSNVKKAKANGYEIFTIREWLDMVNKEARE